MGPLMQLGGLVLLLAATYGPVLALLALLNLRDSRQLRLLSTALKALTWPEFRGRLAIQARCPVLSRRDAVTVDMRDCSRDEIWLALCRLSGSLPPRVRLRVQSLVDRRIPATFTVATGSRPPIPAPLRPPATAR